MAQLAEAVGGQDDLVAGADPLGGQSDKQAHGGTRHGNALGAATVIGEGPLERLDRGALTQPVAA